MSLTREMRLFFFPLTWIQVLMWFFRRGVCWSTGPPTGFCIEKRHRSGVSTSKELVRDKNMRCYFWMDGKNWMVQDMVNEWYHHVTSWSYIRSSSNLHSTAPFLLKNGSNLRMAHDSKLCPPCLGGSFGAHDVFLFFVLRSFF